MRYILDKRDIIYEESLSNLSTNDLLNQLTVEDLERPNLQPQAKI